MAGVGLTGMTMVSEDLFAQKKEKGKKGKAKKHS